MSFHPGSNPGWLNKLKQRRKNIIVTWTEGFTLVGIAWAIAYVLVGIFGK